MTPLRCRMINAMVRRGFALRTQESYVDAMVRMSRFYGRGRVQNRRRLLGQPLPVALPRAHRARKGSHRPNTDLQGWRSAARIPTCK